MRILLAANPRCDKDLHCAKTAADILQKRGIEVHCDSLFQSKNSGSALWEQLHSFDILLVFGGDGTILYAAKKAARCNVPVLGINLGRTGFLSNLSKEELSLLPQLAEGQFSIENRMMLNLEIYRKGKCIYSDLALNDAVLGRGNFSNVVDLTVSIDGKTAYDLTGDGIIIATPTGSTAYSLSAGGPVVEHTLQSMILTPVCAHTLNAHICVLHPDRKVEVMVKPHRGNAAAKLLVDGRETEMLSGKDQIRICRAGVKARFIQLKDGNFYDALLKLG